MKFAKLNPFVPKEPAAFAEFQATYNAELRIYRKRPAFWVGLSVAAVCAIILSRRLDPIESILLLPMIFGVAIAHDTITSHFTKRLIEEKKKWA